MPPSPWKVSLHGGHCGQFCDHAQGTLREILDAAVTAGYHTYGVSEHAPRMEARFLYPEEIALGWDVAKLEQNFAVYAETVAALAEEFADRLTVLRGFEVEVVPANRYVQLMQGFRSQYQFDYLVGSVHYVGEMLIDGTPENFELALAVHDSLESLAIHYYETVAQMVAALKPEVVGHFDVIRKNAGPYGSVDSPAIRRAAEATLEVVREQQCILDLNTAGYRKGLGTPYPAPHLVQLANHMGLDFCFGDDSHSPQDVSAGLDQARQYLLKNGVTSICALARDGASLVRKRIAL